MSPSTQPFDPTPYLSLPRLNAYQAVALAQSLHAAAAAAGELANGAGESPPHIGKALGQMTDDRQTLAIALSPQPVSEPVLRAVDRVEDNAIGAVHDILSGWARIAGQHPLGDTALTLRDQLFAEGLAFINLAPREEWAVVQTKLQIIGQPEVTARLHTLGLEPLLGHLQTTHDRYGQVTGATQPLLPDEAPEIREPLDTLRDSMRQYVLAILGTVSRKDPASRARAERLLQPLVQWRRDTPKVRQKDEGAPGEGGKGEPTKE